MLAQRRRHDEPTCQLDLDELREPNEFDLKLLEQEARKFKPGTARGATLLPGSNVARSEQTTEVYRAPDFSQVRRLPLLRQGGQGWGLAMAVGSAMILLSLAAAAAILALM